MLRLLVNYRLIMSGGKRRAGQTIYRVNLSLALPSAAGATASSGGCHGETGEGVTLTLRGCQGDTQTILKPKKEPRLSQRGCDKRTRDGSIGNETYDRAYLSANWYPEPWAVDEVEKEGASVEVSIQNMRDLISNDATPMRQNWNAMFVATARQMKAR
jgi:hypothetical protein